MLRHSESLARPADAEGGGQESVTPIESSQTRTYFVARDFAANARWWRIVDLAVFGVWLAVVGAVLQRHEPWADEAQSWLLARDLDFRTLWFHELRYNGTPGLWHTILWLAQHWFHAPYAAMGTIGMVCAAGGAAYILWRCPFPRPLPYLLAFSYFVAYQYAVVARSYNLIPLLLFAACDLYDDGEHPERLTPALVLLATVSVHGTLFAGVLGACYLLRHWSKSGGALRRRYLYCAAVLMATFLFVYLVIRSTPDVAVFVNHQVTEPLLMKLELNVAYPLFDWLTPSAIFLVLAGAWCVRRRQGLPFLLLTAGILMLVVLLYGRPHHVGLVFLAVMAGLWIAWPRRDEAQEFSPGERWMTRAMAALLVCVLGVNIWDAVYAMEKDYALPYSGSADAAEYLKRVDASKASIFGYTYGTSAVQAYFDRNIMTNTPTTYYHEGLPLRATSLDVGELQIANPEFVVIYSNDGAGTFNAADPPLRAIGYRLVHVSEGSIFFKRFVFDTDSYFIYRRVQP